MKRIYCIFIIIPVMLICSKLYANEYAVVIDAGSSGSQVYVYEKNESEIRQIDSKKIKPGISSYNITKSSDALTLKIALNNLLTVAKNKISKPNWNATTVTLYATAGMRTIPLKYQQETYELIKNTIIESGLKYQDARTISGSEEGLYMWISANIQNGSHISIASNYGIMDMGGASTQIAFLTDKNNANLEITINDKKYNIYSKSFLGLGNNLIISQFLQEPACFPNGYLSSEISGRWDIEKCENAINSFITSQHQTNKIPSLPQNMTFQAYDDFYKIFNLIFGYNSIQLSNLDLTKNLSICKNYKSVIDKIGDNSDISADQVCFDVAYYYTLLKNYDFNNQKINVVDGTWADGVALVILNDVKIMYLD